MKQFDRGSLTLSLSSFPNRQDLVASFFIGKGVPACTGRSRKSRAGSDLNLRCGHDLTRQGEA